MLSVLALVICTFGVGSNQYMLMNYGNQTLSFSTISTILKTVSCSNVVLFYHSEDLLLVTEMQNFWQESHEDLLFISIDIAQTIVYALREFLTGPQSLGHECVRIVLLRKETEKLLEITCDVYNNSNKTTNYQTGMKWILLQIGEPCSKCRSCLHIQHAILLQYTDPSAPSFTLVQDRWKPMQCQTRKHQIDLSSCTISDLYPQLKYRLNRRHLLIGTLKAAGLENVIIEELGNTLSNILNFTYSFVEPADRKYSGFADGKWQGLVGLLVQNEVDLVLAELTITAERLKVIDFIYPPFITQSLDAVYKKTGETDNDWLKIFSPLTTEVYLCTFGSIGLVGTLLFYLDHLEKPKPQFLDYANFFVILIGFISIRGQGIWPNAVSSRILVAFCWMFCLVICSVYIGNLTAKLSETKAKNPFNSLEELVELSDWKWKTYAGGSTIRFLEFARGGALKSIWDGLVVFNETDPSVLEYDVTNFISNMTNPLEKYAYIVNDGLHYVMNTNDCSLAMVEGVKTASQLAIGVPKNSHLKRDLETAMLMLLNTGFLQHFRNIRYKDGRSFECRAPDTKRSLKVEDIKGSFLLLCFGLGLSMIILITEIIYGLRRTEL